MDHSWYTSHTSPQRPTRLHPLRAVPLHNRSPVTPFQTPDRSTSGTVCTSSFTGSRGRSRGLTHNESLYAGLVRTMPARQSKPLGGGEKRAASHRPPSHVARSENPFAAHAALLTTQEAADLTLTLGNFDSEEEEAYATRHELPALFSSLIHDASEADAERVGSGRTWVREWFARRLAASPPRAPSPLSSSRPSTPVEGQTWQPTHSPQQATRHTSTPRMPHHESVRSYVSMQSLIARNSARSSGGVVNAFDRTNSVTSITSCNDKLSRPIVASVPEALSARTDAVQSRARHSIEPAAAEKSAHHSRLTSLIG